MLRGNPVLVLQYIYHLPSSSTLTWRTSNLMWAQHPQSSVSLSQEQPFDWTDRRPFDWTDRRPFDWTDRRPVWRNSKTAIQVSQLHYKNRPVSRSWKVTRPLHQSEDGVELVMIETCKWLLNVLKKVSIIASSTLVSLSCKSLVTFQECETGLLT
jgi:hypothetical protein